MTDRENKLIERLMQGEINLYSMEYAPTLKLGDLPEGNYIQVSRNGNEMLAEEETDPKTAFLTELSDLLRKYDAKIHVWAGEDGDKVLTFELKDNIDIVYPNEWINDHKFEFPITPDNIFNYDKE